MTNFLLACCPRQSGCAPDCNPRVYLSFRLAKPRAQGKALEMKAVLVALDRVRADQAWREVTLAFGPMPQARQRAGARIKRKAILPEAADGNEAISPDQAQASLARVAVSIG